MLKKAKKRHMLLLEVLIALALIALCAIPLIAPQVSMLTQQTAFIQRMELDHAAHLLYVRILEQLHLNRIDWNDVETKRMIPITQDMLKASGFNKNLPYTGSLYFDIIKHKFDDPKEWNAYRVKLTFVFHRTHKEEDKAEYAYITTIVRHHMMQTRKSETDEGGP